MYRVIFYPNLREIFARGTYYESPRPILKITPKTKIGTTEKCPRIFQPLTGGGEEKSGYQIEFQNFSISNFGVFHFIRLPDSQGSEAVRRKIHRKLKKPYQRTVPSSESRFQISNELCDFGAFPAFDATAPAQRLQG